MKKKKKIGLLFFALCFLLSTGAIAFEDVILTSRIEVWKAARETLQSSGFSSEDQNEGKLKTRWIEDTVVKERPVFSGPWGSGPTVKQTFRRRYRISIVIDETKNGALVKIHGEFEQKIYSARPQAPWQREELTTEDYDVERAVFFKILRHLEISRKAPGPMPM